MLLNDLSMTSFAFVYSGLLIMVISKEDKILIKNLLKSKGCSARRFCKEFPDKNWNRTGLDYVLKKLRQMCRLLWNGRLVAAGDARQSTVDMAIKQWCGRLRACESAKGGHFEHSL